MEKEISGIRDLRQGSVRIGRENTNKLRYNPYPIEGINEMQSIDEANFWFVNNRKEEEWMLF